MRESQLYILVYPIKYQTLHALERWNLFVLGTQEERRIMRCCRDSPRRSLIQFAAPN